MTQPLAMSQVVNDPHSGRRVVIGNGRPGNNDPNATADEQNTLDYLARVDTQFREKGLPQLIAWAQQSEFYGDELRYNPDKQIIYITGDGKGSKLEKAVMYTIPNATMQTPMGPMETALLGANTDFKKNVDEMQASTGKSRDLVELYAITHEYIHIISTMKLLSKPEVHIEGTTDYILLSYFADLRDNAATKTEKWKFQQLYDIAAHRVGQLSKQGYRAPKDKGYNNRTPQQIPHSLRQMMRLYASNPTPQGLH